MILADTSVWIQHLRTADPNLALLLEDAAVVTHPLVIGEIIAGSIPHRSAVLSDLRRLPMLGTASFDEIMVFVEERALFGRGLSIVDIHALASVILRPGARLWTHDKALARAAHDLDIAWTPAT